MNRIIAVAQVALCFVFMFCNNGGGQTKPPELVGHWVGVEERRGVASAIGKMELFKDGTGVSDDKTISWKVENKRFVILSSNKGLSCDYEVSGYVLILFEDDGNNKQYIKKEMWDILERAIKAMENKKYDEAIAIYSEAIKKDPNYVNGYFSRFSVYMTKGDNDKALAELDKAIKVSKRPLDIASAYLIRGMYYLDKEDYDKAIADFELSLQKESSVDAKYYGSIEKKELSIEKTKGIIDIAKERKENK